MKKIYLYNVPAATEEAIGASKLLSVSTLTKIPNRQAMMDTNQFPAASLFNNKTLLSIDSNSFYVIDEKGAKVAFLEKTTDGCDYRWYNNASKSLATVIRCLVFGSDKYDLICANVGMEIEKTGDLVVVRNITTINGKPWKDVPLNGRELRMKGFHWCVTNVSDGTYGSLKNLFENGGYSQLGATNKDQVTITNKAGVVADYTFLEKDQTDLDAEFLLLNFIAAVKNEGEYLRVPFTELFN